MNRTLVSLFTGAGGLDLGLEMAGFKTLVASELEPHACETLRKNKELSSLKGEDLDRFVHEALKQRCFNKISKEEADLFFKRVVSQNVKEPYLQECTVIEGDIREIRSRDFQGSLPSSDLFCVAGGPPCQPFSKAGKRKSFDCTKNGDLFYEFVRVVRDLRPKWFIFENVKGITFTKTDVIYQRCLHCGNSTLAPFHIRQNFEEYEFNTKCLSCGMEGAEWLKVNEKGGSLKIIFNEFQKLGYKCSSKVFNAADFGVPQTRERLFIVGSRDGVDFEWPSPTHANLRKMPEKDLFSEFTNKKPWVTMEDAIWDRGHPIYGEIDAKTAKLWVKNVVRPHDEPVTWSLDRPSPTIGAHQGAKLAFAPQGVPEKQLLRQQWATKGKKQGDTPPVPVEHRYLSDAELLKLQTFPEWWYLHGTRMQRAFQIGNAVPPLLAKAIGEALLRVEEKYGN